MRESKHCICNLAIRNRICTSINMCKEKEIDCLVILCMVLEL